MPLKSGDGRADVRRRFGSGDGHGVALTAAHLFFAASDRVVRWPRAAGELAPEGDPETLVPEFPEQSAHAVKAIALGPGGALYVEVGAPSNACQEDDRTQGSPGQEPCPLLEEHAGIWRFDADKTGQSFADGERFVTGTRNVVALDWNPRADALYFVMHGRDQLHQLFPDLYSEEQSAELPAEELHRVREGASYGWPYTYWDQQAARRMVGPEYGGDGQTPAQAGRHQDPLLAFPGHLAPKDLLVYTAEEGLPAPAPGGAARRWPTPTSAKPSMPPSTAS